MQITGVSNISFKARAVRLPKETETQIVDLATKAGKSYLKAIQAEYPMDVVREMRKAHRLLDKAIKLNPKGVFARFPKVNGRKYDTQKLYFDKYFASLMVEHRSKTPSLEEIVELNKRSPLAMSIKRMIRNVGKAIDKVYGKRR